MSFLEMDIIVMLGSLQPNAQEKNGVPNAENNIIFYPCIEFLMLETIDLYVVNEKTTYR